MKNKLLAWILFFRIAVAVWFVTYKEVSISTGTEVLLETAPVDPRDIFRGDYVILWYKISSACSDFNNSREDWANGTDWEDSEKMYVQLDIDDQWIANAIWCTTEKPQEGLFISWTFTSRFNTEFGIERYYVQEWSGKELEKIRWQNLLMKVSIDKKWNPIIIGHKIREDI